MTLTYSGFAYDENQPHKKADGQMQRDDEFCRFENRLHL